MVNNARKHKRLSASLCEENVLNRKIKSRSVSQAGLDCSTDPQNQIRVDKHNFNVGIQVYVDRVRVCNNRINEDIAFKANYQIKSDVSRGKENHIEFGVGFNF